MLTLGTDGGVPFVETRRRLEGTHSEVGEQSGSSHPEATRGESEPTRELGCRRYRSKREAPRRRYRGAATNTRGPRRENHTAQLARRDRDGEARWQRSLEVKSVFLIKVTSILTRGLAVDKDRNPTPEA